MSSNTPPNPPEIKAWFEQVPSLDLSGMTALDIVGTIRPLLADDIEKIEKKLAEIKEGIEINRTAQAKIATTLALINTVAKILSTSIRLG